MKTTPYTETKMIHCVDTGEVVSGDKYLSSKHWRDLRVRIYNYYNGRCQRCGDYFPLGKMNVHHRIYSRLGKEQLSDLVLYCGHCHSCVHSKTPHKLPKKRDLGRLIMNYLTPFERNEAYDLLIKHFNIDVDLIEKEQNEAIQKNINRRNKQRMIAGKKPK